MLEKPIAITMGEPAGCGGEITIKAWQKNRSNLPPFFMVDDFKRLEKLIQQLKIDCNLKQIKEPSEAINIFATALPIMQVNPSLSENIIPGRPNPLNSKSIISSIDTAVYLASNNLVKAVVTNPIFKAGLQSSGFKYSGHTEYLGKLANTKETPIMMLSSNNLKKNLRVIPITTHIPHKDISNALNKDKIINISKRIYKYLSEDFGIKKPKIAVAALNPHAGENGKLGFEEIEIIIPALKKLNKLKVNISGPYPADTLFHSDSREKFDAILCMYHDQALIPLKTLDFYSSVNITLGLPFVRTSPDHGTAFDLSGTGKASPESLISAIKVANELATIKKTN
jgi:4-hydroxythreonine-4-phosphate dehydrogenase